MALHIPKLREGSYFPSLLEPRRRSEKALLSVIQQAYVEGVNSFRLGEVNWPKAGCRTLARVAVVMSYTGHGY